MESLIIHRRLLDGPSTYRYDRPVRSTPGDRFARSRAVVGVLSLLAIIFIIASTAGPV